MTTTRAPWSRLPRELAKGFLPGVDALATAMVRAIGTAVPEYSATAVARVVRHALLDCLDQVGTAKPPHTRVFRNLGKVEFTAGRSLDCLQTAYRVAGRVAWRHVSEFGKAAGLGTNALCLTADAIFAYVDEISALSVEGYTAARNRSADTIAHRRRKLLELLLADPPVSPEAVADQAAVAEWALPAAVTVVALEPRTGQHDLAAPELHGDVLADLEGGEPCLVTGDPARHLKNLASRLRGRRAVIGPTVQLADAVRSQSWARRTLHLVQRGIIVGGPVISCADHLSTLWLLADEFLVKELAARALSPFDDLTPKQRARFGETLLIWLQSRDSAPEIAKRLNLHPQTVRYRVRRLTDLFGDRLKNADDRLTVELALRAEALLTNG